MEITEKHNAQLQWKPQSEKKVFHFNTNPRFTFQKTISEITLKFEK